MRACGARLPSVLRFVLAPLLLATMSCQAAGHRGIEQGRYGVVHIPPGADGKGLVKLVDESAERVAATLGLSCPSLYRVVVSSEVEAVEGYGRVIADYNSEKREIRLSARALDMPALPVLVSHELAHQMAADRFASLPYYLREGWIEWIALKSVDQDIAIAESARHFGFALRSCGEIRLQIHSDDGDSFRAHQLTVPLPELTSGTDRGTISALFVDAPLKDEALDAEARALGFVAALLMTDDHFVELPSDDSGRLNKRLEEWRELLRHGSPQDDLGCSRIIEALARMENGDGRLVASTIDLLAPHVFVALSHREFGTGQRPGEGLLGMRETLALSIHGVTSAPIDLDLLPHLRALIER